MIGKMISEFQEIHLEGMSGKELRRRLKGLHDIDRVMVCIMKTDKDHAFKGNTLGDIVWVRKEIPKPDVKPTEVENKIP